MAGNQTVVSIGCANPFTHSVEVLRFEVELWNGFYSRVWVVVLIDGAPVEGGAPRHYGFGGCGQVGMEGKKW